MLLAESFTVPVKPVQKPAKVVTNEKPFFQPKADTSKMSTGAVTQPVEVFTSASPVQATGDIAASMTATQLVEAPGTKRGSAASMTTTRPGIVRVATQPVEAPSAWKATQPIEAPGARSEVQPTGSVDGSAVDRSLTSKRTVADDNTGVSDTEDVLNSEPASPAVFSDQEVLSDRGLPKDNELDQEFSEEANYRETMRVVCSIMPTMKVSIKLPADDWLCRKLEKLNFTIAEGYSSRNAETAGLLRDQFVKTPRSYRWYNMHTDKNDSG